MNRNFQLEKVTTVEFFLVPVCKRFPLEAEIEMSFNCLTSYGGRFLNDVASCRAAG